MKKLRSQNWFGGQDKDGFIHRSWMKNNGLPDDAFDGRPVIGICNTFSDFTPCNAHFRELVTHIKAGVLEAGGLPLEFPVFSCGEFEPAPDGDAVSQPRLDGCRRGDPRQSDGRGGADGRLRQDHAVAGHGGRDLRSADHCRLGRADAERAPSRVSAIGSGTDVWKFSEAVRAGEMSAQEFSDAESAMSRSPGHCMTMGTASTMASMVEALGITLPGNAAWPAVDARRARLARMSGRRIVEMVREDQSPVADPDAGRLLKTPSG